MKYRIGSDDSSVYRSAVPGFVFPALIGPREVQVVSLHAQIDASQWWEPERIRAHQLRQLATLIEHARQHVPFYADRLAELPQAEDGQRLDAAWQRLTLLTRDELRAHGARLRSPAASAHGPAVAASTSGSSGVPVSIDQTAAFWLLYRAVKLRMLMSYGHDLRGKQVEIIPLPAGNAPGAVQRVPGEWPFNVLFETGPIVRMDIFRDIDSQIALLDAESPQYLVTHPSNLRLLLAAYRRMGRSIPTLRLVRTRAEQLDPELRGACRDVLGAPILDAYGATECGYIAIQCPDHDHYHVQSELNLVEVLSEDGRQCTPGETGRIVVTPLHAFAMPLLRYALDDYAEVGGPCPCGRGLPVLRRIFGRHKALLTLPSGEKRYSTFASYVFGGLPAVARFQIVQKSLLEIEARIVAARPLTQAERAKIVDGLRGQLGAGYSIHIRLVDDIPRSPGGKFMEFISEV